MRSSKPSRRVRPLATICGSKLLSAVAWHSQLDRPVIADHGLARIAVAAVAAAAPRRITLLVTQMLRSTQHPAPAPADAF